MKELIRRWFSVFTLWCLQFGVGAAEAVYGVESGNNAWVYAGLFTIGFVNWVSCRNWFKELEERVDFKVCYRLLANYVEQATGRKLPEHTLPNHEWRE